MDKHAERVERNDALSTGTLAPAFELRSTPDQSVRLGDFSGRRLIMAFYPADWSPVCTDQMALYNEILPEFQELGAALVGISIDHAWCHAAFAQSRNLHFPLLADFHPKGDVAPEYGVYDDEIGMSERALFVIDEKGVIRWSHVSPIGVNPGADGILAALESMSAAPVPAQGPMYLYSWRRRPTRGRSTAAGRSVHRARALADLTDWRS